MSATAPLASIVLDRSVITSAIKEATMPVLVRDTPLGRQWGGRRASTLPWSGRQRCCRGGASATPRIEAITVRSAELPDEERLTLIDAANNLDDLA